LKRPYAPNNRGGLTDNIEDATRRARTAWSYTRGPRSRASDSILREDVQLAEHRLFRSSLLGQTVNSYAIRRAKMRFRNCCWQWPMCRNSRCGSYFAPSDFTQTCGSIERHRNCDHVTGGAVGLPGAAYYAADLSREEYLEKIAVMPGQTGRLPSRGNHRGLSGRTESDFEEPSALEEVGTRLFAFKYSPRRIRPRSQ